MIFVHPTEPEPNLKISIWSLITAFFTCCLVIRVHSWLILSNHLKYTGA